MAKYAIFSPASSANGPIGALTAPGQVERKRGRGGSAIGLLSPATWDGTGAVPIGWTLPWGVLPEEGGARVALVATDAFAAGRPQFAGALDQLPGDWA